MLGDILQPDGGFFQLGVRALLLLLMLECQAFNGVQPVVYDIDELVCFFWDLEVLLLRFPFALPVDRDR